MKNYIKPEFEVTSIFAQENIASDGTIPYVWDHSHIDGGSSVYIGNSDKGGWDLWDD